MEKTVLSKHSRRHSTGNLLLEVANYDDVLSRYLKAPFPSCHDNCKQQSPGSESPTQPKLTRKRSNKTDPDSPQGTKKPFALIPRSPTRNVKTNITSIPRHQVKSPLNDSKSQDFKSKSKTAETDPFYITPSRITRRYSDVNLSTKILGDVHVSPAAFGQTRNNKRFDKKIDSRKEVKSVKGNVKTTVDGPVSKKVQTLKTTSGPAKPGVDNGPKKSKSIDPVGEVVQEKSDKSQKPDEERVLQNGAQNATKSEKDETPGNQSQSQSQSQKNGSIKKTENPSRVRKIPKEKEELSSQKVKFKQGKTIGSQSESNGQRKVNFEKGKVLDENKIGQVEGKSLRRLSTDDVVIHTPESKPVSVALKPCDTVENKPDVRLNNVIEEAASRLIKTRKSKVQALVGAFEMVSENKF